MRGDMVSELRLAALYANQVARAIVRMDDRLSIFFCNAMRSTHNTFAIDVLGTRDHSHDYVVKNIIMVYMLISLLGIAVSTG